MHYIINNQLHVMTQKVMKLYYTWGKVDFRRQYKMNALAVGPTIFQPNFEVVHKRKSI